MPESRAIRLVRTLVPPSIRRRAFKLVQRRLNRWGYSFVVSPPRTGAPDWDVWDWVKQTSQIRTIIDIGANDGSFAAFLNDFFQPVALHAFEPLPSCQPALNALRARIPHLTIHQLALGEAAGELELFENAFGPASSVLPVSDVHRQAFPDAEHQGTSVVKAARLDDVLSLDALERDVMIKVDVQGVEDRVIRGGTAIFSVATVVLVEMSFVAMYEGQSMFEEVHDLLVGCGLRLAGFKNQIDEPGSARPLFAHCLYRRPDRSTSGQSCR